MTENSLIYIFGLALGFLSLNEQTIMQGDISSILPNISSLTIDH